MHNTTRYQYKQLAKESWRTYDCDPVGGNCPEDAFSFISGFIEGALHVQASLKETQSKLDYVTNELTWLKTALSGVDRDRVVAIISKLNTKE